MLQYGGTSGLLPRDDQRIVSVAGLSSSERGAGAAVVYEQLESSHGDKAERGVIRLRHMFR